MDTQPVCVCGAEMLPTAYGARCPRCGNKWAWDRSFQRCACGCGRAADVRDWGLAWSAWCWLGRQVEPSFEEVDHDG